jgi:hypothetical protein
MNIRLVHVLVHNCVSQVRYGDVKLIMWAHV